MDPGGEETAGLGGGAVVDLGDGVALADVRGAAERRGGAQQVRPAEEGRAVAPDDQVGPKQLLAVVATIGSKQV